MDSLPPPARWWPTYVLIGAGAFVAVTMAFTAGLGILTPLAHVGELLLFAIVVAFAIAPLEGMLERKLGSRGPAVGLAYLIVVAGLGAIFTLMARPLIEQSSYIGEKLPQLIERIQSSERFAIGEWEIPSQVREQLSSMLKDSGGNAAKGALNTAFNVANTIFDALLTLVLSLYLLLDAPRIRDLTLELVKPEHRKHVALVESEVARVFGAYLRGQLLLAFTMFVLTTAALTALGMPYAWLLGAFAGFTELIPVLGPILGALPALLLAAAQPFPMLVWVFLVFVAIQQLEAHVLGPRISGRAVGFRPLVAMVALLVGLQLGGVLGALFAIPIAGVLWALASATFIANHIPGVEAVVEAIGNVEAKIEAETEVKAEEKAEGEALAKGSASPIEPKPTEADPALITAERVAAKIETKVEEREAAKAEKEQKIAEEAAPPIPVEPVKKKGARKKTVKKPKQA